MIWNDSTDFDSFKAAGFDFILVLLLKNCDPEL